VGGVATGAGGTATGPLTGPLSGDGDGVAPVTVGVVASVLAALAFGATQLRRSHRPAVAGTGPDGPASPGGGRHFARRQEGAHLAGRTNRAHRTDRVDQVRRSVGAGAGVGDANTADETPSRRTA
jgi:hypothetical protein